MLATVKKLGGSVAIVIPKGVAEQNQLSPGSTVDLTTVDGGFVVRRVRRKRRAIEDIAAAIDPVVYADRRRELKQDRPVGRETW